MREGIEFMYFKTKRHIYIVQFESTSAVSNVCRLGAEPGSVFGFPRRSRISTVASMEPSLIWYFAPSADANRLRICFTCAQVGPFGINILSTSVQSLSEGWKDMTSPCNTQNPPSHEAPFWPDEHGSLILGQWSKRKGLV